MIDFQRDFVDPGGFGEALGNDVSLLRRPCRRRARAGGVPRAPGMLVIHTREGHRPDLSDLPPAKKARGRSTTASATSGRWAASSCAASTATTSSRSSADRRRADRRQAGQGRVLRHRPGRHPEDARHHAARRLRRDHRGLRPHDASARRTTAATTASCSSDCVASYFPEFQRVALEMIKAQGGIFGWVGDSERFLAALARRPARTPACGGSGRAS